MLLVLTLGWATLQGGRFLLPPLLPRITETLAFSPAGIGTVLTAFGLVYALVQYPSGTYSDTLSRATLILPAFLVLVVSFVAIALSVRAGIFVVAILLLGVGKGLYTSPSRALVGDLFTARRGRALGLYTAGTDAGGLLGSGLAVAVLATTAWQVAFLPVIVILACVTVLYVFWNRESYVRERVRLEPGATVRRIVATREQRETLAAFAVFYFFVGGLTNFFPTLLVAGGFSETVAGASFALLFGAGILAKPVGGELSDRFSSLLVSIAGLLVAIVGTAFVLVAPTLPVVAVGTVLTAVGYKTLFPIADTVVMSAAPDGSMGADLGAARAVFLTASALGPGFIGITAELTGFVPAFWVLSGTLSISAVLLARQYRRS